MSAQLIKPEDAPKVHGVRDFAPFLEHIFAKSLSGDFEFGPGNYHFYPDKLSGQVLYISNTDSQKYPEKKYALTLANKKNVRLIGHQSCFIVHGDIGSLAILDCERIEIEGITIKYQCPNVIDLQVAKVTLNPPNVVFCYPDCYQLKVNKGEIIWQSDRSPYTGEVYWESTQDLDLSQRFEWHSKKVYRLVENLFTKAINFSVNEKQLTVSFKELPEISVGDVFQMREIDRQVTGMFIDKSKEITFHKTTVHFLNDMGVVSQLSDNLTFDNCRFIPEEGHYSSSGADILHFSSCREKVVIKDCIFCNPHDDMINIHGTFLQVDAGKDNVLEISYQHHQTLGFAPFRVGDKVLLYDSKTLVPVSTDYQVLGLVQNGSLRHYQVILDRAVELDNLDNLVIDNLSAQPEVVIENNHFERCPTRGILISTQGNTRIENNLFTHIFYASIFISGDANDWYESGPINNVLIRNNHFEKCYREVLLVEPTNEHYAQKKVHGQIKIENNFISTSFTPYFSFKSVDRVQLKKNFYNRKFTEKEFLAIETGEVLNDYLMEKHCPF